LKGHKQFEWQTKEREWKRCVAVDSMQNHRIYHDIPEGWTRHDGELYKARASDLIEQVMFCTGELSKSPKGDGCAYNWDSEFNHKDPSRRIYAYKLAKPAISIPEGFTKWDGRDECPVAPDAMVEVILKDGEMHKRFARNWNWEAGLKYAIIAYRVIEKKVVPWTRETCPSLPFEVIGIETPNRAAVIGANETHLRISHNLVSYADALVCWRRLNGEVCGAEETK
jgi:hypothetical protein